MEKEKEFIIFSPGGKAPEQMIYAVLSCGDVSVCVQGENNVLLCFLFEILKGLCPEDKSEREIFIGLVIDMLKMLDSNIETEN